MGLILNASLEDVDRRRRSLLPEREDPEVDIPRERPKFTLIKNPENE